MELDLPFEVYKNLFEFMSHRNVQHNHTQFDKTEFAKEISAKEYMRMTGTRENKHGKRPFIVLLIAPNSLAAKKVPNFKKLFKNTIAKQDLESNAEIVIVSAAPLTNFITAQITTDRRAHPGLYLEHYSYAMFSIIIPQHKQVPHHAVVSQEEIEFILDYFKTEKSNFPKITTADPMVVWLGARPGDMIKIIREPESGGRAIGYRVVKK